ncbi:hypothetical protein CGJ03_04900 [Vibrio parahaemolyticus]|nr:hypothetical protein CGJ03_04900 [Vibrio parahaemolyticus]
MLGGKLSLRDYNAQAGESYAMIKALNKLTGLGMPETCRIASKCATWGRFTFVLNYATKSYYS